MAILLRTTAASSTSLQLQHSPLHRSTSPSSSVRNLFPSAPVFFLRNRYRAPRTPSPSLICFPRPAIMATIKEHSSVTSSESFLHAGINDCESNKRYAPVVAKVEETNDGAEAIKESSVGFFLDDGVLYTSLDVSDHGFPIVCNGKGCRPLTGSECKKLGILTLACGSWPRIEKEDAESAMEAHYQKLLQGDPRNALVLANYARFLFQRRDVKRSEEHYERAILSDPHDAEILVEYARLQWDVHRDGERAQMYYDQALQAAAAHESDLLCSNVMASYTSFLLESEKADDAGPP